MFSIGLTGMPFISSISSEENTMKLVGSVNPISNRLTSFRSIVSSSINTIVSDILLRSLPPVRV